MGKDDIKIDESLPENENKICPFCNKNLNKFNDNEEKHMLDCYTKMEKDMLLQNKRKRKNILD